MTTPASAATAAKIAARFRDEIIEDFLVNALECLHDGDGLPDRDRAIIMRAFGRVQTRALMTLADGDRRG